MRTIRFAVPLLLLLGVAPVGGQIPEGMEGDAFRPHPEATRAISELYSPFCPGQMLETCPSPNAAALRDSLQALAYEGLTAPQIKAWMLANHGEEYRAVPEPRGLGLWAWLLPPLGLILGTAIVVAALRRIGPERGGSAAEGEASEPPIRISSEEEDRLRSAIRDIELSEDPSF